MLCIQALEEAITKYGIPEICNIDQVVQFPCQDFMKAVLDRGILFSMDGEEPWIMVLWKDYGEP